MNLRNRMERIQKLLKGNDAVILCNLCPEFPCDKSNCKAKRNNPHAICLVVDEP